MDTVQLFVGYDEREAVAYHVFCESVLEKASLPVAFRPIDLKGFQRDGSNAFTFSRYLVPFLCDFRGWAIFADGDMVCNADIAELWNERHRHLDKAVAVVKHDYSTRHPRKYIGSRMECENKDYPRKNWSSVILWDCSHFGNRCLTEEYIATADTKFLHRFGWLKDEAIGALAPDWNHLVGEDPPGPASLFHYTLGISGIKHYADDTASWNWHRSLLRLLECSGESAAAMVKRAEDRLGELKRHVI